MQSIDTNGLTAFDCTLEKMLKDAPAERRGLHIEFADLLESEIGTAIASSGLNDSHGMIRHWQVKHVGSRGGYAAIRAASSNDGAPIGKNGAGAITNYLENGHTIRKPKGNKGYRPRIRVSYVSGYHFYRTAKTTVETKAIGIAEDFANRLADKLESGGQ